jgi:serine/threonine protein kinase
VIDAPLRDKYCLKKHIGRSTFLGFNLTSGEEVAIKVDLDSAIPVNNYKTTRLEYETDVYNALEGGVGIPFVHCFRTHCFDLNRDFMVLDLQGPSLEDLFDFCHRKFSLKTILLLTNQLISRLEEFHNKRWFLCNITLKGFVMGFRKFSNQVRVIKLSQAQPQDPQDLDLSALTEESLEIGTYYIQIPAITYTNLSEPSCRNDLEKLGRILLYFTCSYASWQDLKDTSTTELCRDLPEILAEEFTTYFKYVGGLHPGDKPDYPYLKKVFNDLFFRIGFENDYVFDWVIRKYQKDLKPKRVLPEMLNTKGEGIYAGLEMVEKKCIKMAERQADPAIYRKFNQIQRKKFVSFYLLLLSEHHDYFLATQHPTASQHLKQLASELNMPSRMLHHGILTPLRLLIDELPKSLSNFLLLFRFS